VDAIVIVWCEPERWLAQQFAEIQTANLGGGRHRNVKIFKRFRDEVETGDVSFRTASDSPETPMNLRTLATLSLAGCVALFACAVIADEAPVFTVDPAIATMTADQKVDARERAMKADGGALRAASRTIGPDAVKLIDTALQNFTNFPALFAGGATNGKSEADPQIWKEFDKFTALFDKGKADLLVARAAALAGDKAGLQKAIGAVSTVCSDCHNSYRTE
jgi:cytochrome c556